MPAQEAVLRAHCAHARYVWNLAVEQHSHWHRGKKGAPGYLEQCRQLTQARAEHPWLAWGSQTVQQQAFMPPPAAAEEAVVQLVPLPVLPLALPLLEFEELQPTVSSRLPVTAAAAAMACLARKIPSQTTVPAGGDHDADLG